MSTAPAHELQLAFEAQEILRTLAGRLPTWAELDAIREEQGIEIAQTVFYRAILQSQPHSAFIRHVQSAKPGFHDHRVGKSPVEVVIIPSVMPETPGVWGEHVEWMRSLAREMGFTTDVIETQRADSVAGNAWRIGEHLKTTTASRVILVSTGRGSAEVRMYLQRRGKNATEAKKIRGWLNINGCVHGSTLLERNLNRPTTRIKMALTSALLRKKAYATSVELASNFPLWREQLATHQKLMTVSAFGMILPNQVPVGTKDSYEFLQTKGLNDGYLLAKEMIVRPGLLFPIPGLQHSFDEAMMQGQLQRLLTCMGAAIVRDDQTLRKTECPVITNS